MSVDTLVAQAIATEIGPQEPWPDNALVYQPDEVGHIVLPDQATCLAVKTFLEMCGLGYIVEYRANAEEMSPSGRVPFIQAGAFLISELDPIIGFVNTKGFSLSSELGDEERSELRAYMSLIDNVLLNAECYLAWCDEMIYSEVTKPRYGSVHPWPLSSIIPMRKRWEVRSRLKTIGWTQKTMNELHPHLGYVEIDLALNFLPINFQKTIQVCDEVIACCQALSERLDRQDYFFGDKPTELDALVYGHLASIITAKVPEKRLKEILLHYNNLIEFCDRIEKRYYPNLKTIEKEDLNTNSNNDLEIIEKEDLEIIEKEDLDINEKEEKVFDS